ncbi:hypothetical protein [Spongiactinospora sp. TRM90649]|uniref:hypothetical protein n=1 Tax=Spongiactinospora sp. TRM90649 TaxID=3031114 RepID=UPI0023F9BE26|nr:hypothetical protein [Spongiactinospora sp. TRM90649]MDF5751939.1 hypothetical protein [Spongiactinospora sp. TRM90649]
MPERTTSRDSNLYGCKLTERDLRRLADLINQGFSEKAELTASATVDDVTINSKSIDELLKEIDDGTEVLNRTSIQSVEYQPIYRRARVFFYNGFTGVLVNGSDHTWVLGKHEELVRFLSTKVDQPRILVLRITWWALIGLSLAANIGALAAISQRLPTSGVFAVIFALASFPLLATFAGRAIRTERKSAVILHDTKHRKIDHIAVASLVAGIIGALASIVQTIVAIASGQ